HHVGLVCCAHALLFDHHVDHVTRFVVSGGGGTALCSHLRGVCAGGPGRPEDGGALVQAVEPTVTGGGGGRGPARGCAPPPSPPSPRPPRSPAASSKPSTPSTGTPASASATIRA